jgi:hypothetical protein
MTPDLSSLDVLNKAFVDLEQATKANLEMLAASHQARLSYIANLTNLQAQFERVHGLIGDQIAAVSLSQSAPIPNAVNPQPAA